jgi:5'-3' exonuclease
MQGQPDYEPNQKHVIHGLDADLIMLGLTTHEPYFALLREDVLRRTRKVSVTGAWIPALFAVKGAEKVDNFHLLHLCMLREYWDEEFRSQNLPFRTRLCFIHRLSLFASHCFSFYRMSLGLFAPVASRSNLGAEYDLEAIVDDIVLMCFFVGNDFLPRLSALDIAQNGLNSLFEMYKKTLPTLGGYLVERGSICTPPTLLIRTVLMRPMCRHPPLEAASKGDIHLRGRALCHGLWQSR